ncbi:hypothetical protein ABZX93_05950 [Streptomyces sp. NPDC006632]|uniref:hypothetical protein n=1 Tax=Streptomyces sp. NPDC006632 TaxID=3157182 RepID=UPI0033A5811C
MTEILVMDQPMGDTVRFVRACWIEFLLAHRVPPLAFAECARSTAEPVHFNRQMTDAATVLRPNLLSPAWWREGMAETASCVLPAIIPFEIGEAA